MMLPPSTSRGSTLFGGSVTLGMEFVASSRFTGAKKGYVFKNGKSGTGYYIDTKAAGASQALPGGFFDEEPNEESGSDRKRRRDEYERKTAEDILLEEAEAAAGAKPEGEAIIALEDKSLTNMLVSLEKGIKANETMRVKHSDPSKFMETELDLHGAVQDLHAIAASPELYPVLLNHGSGLDNLLSLLGHENTDIVVAVLELFVEMSDISDDAPEADEQYIMSFCAQWVNAKGALESVVPSLGCYDWTLEEGGDILATTEKGVTATLILLENLLEVEKRADGEEGGVPAVGSTLLTKTDALSVLCGVFTKIKGFHPLKLHASEIVSALLGHEVASSGESQAQALEIVEPLLQAQAGYRKKAPALGAEEEYYLNVTLSLSSLCRLHPEAKVKMAQTEGVELQLLILKQHAGDVNVQGALQVLSYLTSDNTECALKAVEEGALKQVFPFLLGSKALLCRKGKGGSQSGAEKVLIQEHAVSIVANLVVQLHDSSSFDVGTRLALKLAEKMGEKLRKACELFVKYHASVCVVERDARATVDSLTSQIEQLSKAVMKVGRSDKATVMALEETQAELELQEDDELGYARRLRGGLHELQQLAIIIAFGVLYDPSGDKRGHVRLGGETLKEKGAKKDLGGVAVGLVAVVGTLREQAAMLVRGEGEGGGEIAKKSKEKQALLIQWVARLAHVLEGGVSRD